MLISSNVPELLGPAVKLYQKKALKQLVLNVLLLSSILFLFRTNSSAQVVFTSLQGNAATYVKGTSNSVPYGLSIFVPAGGTFDPAVLNVGLSQSLNGFVNTITLNRVTSANPALATSSATTYGVNLAGIGLQVNSFPTLTGAAGTGTTYYFYFVINFNTSTNPPPGFFYFFLPSTGITQNPYGGGMTINNTNSKNYFFGNLAPAFTYTNQVFTVNTAISQVSPSNTGGTSTSASSSPALPAGLSISATGVISGTPTVISAATNYTITATNASGSSTSVINITVNPPPPTVSYTSPQTFTVNTAITNLTPATTNSPTSFSTTGLPAGLSLNTTTGVISGTPTTASASAVYSVTATNAGGSGSASITITVNAIAPTVTTTTPSAIASTSATVGGSITSTGGTTVTEYGVVYSTTATTPTTANSKFTIGTNAAAANTYSSSLTGLSSNTLYYVRAYAINSAGTSYGAVTSFTTPPPPPTISYATPQIYAINNAILTLTPTVTNSPTSFTTTGLPAGLSLNATTGAITGTPTALSGSTDYTVTATNAGGSTSATINISIDGPPIIAYATPQTYSVNVGITPLSPTNTGDAVYPSNYGASTTFASPTGPYAVAVDASNNVYTVDNTNGFLYKYNSAGTQQFVVNLPGTNAPTSVAVDGSGNIFVSSFITPTFGSTTYAVYKYNSAGTLLATYTGFNQPYGIAFDASDNVYISDYGTGNIIRIPSSTATGNIALTTANNYLTGFTTPYGIAFNAAGDMYVSQQTLNNVIRIAAGSTTKNTFYNTGLNGPRHLETDAFGNVFVADYSNNAVKRLNSSGTLTQTISTGLNLPRQVAFDASGSMYVADYGSNTIKKFTGTQYSISATLPAGLSFDTSTGIISGTPTTITAATNYTITAYNTSGSSSTVVNIAVNSLSVTTGNYAFSHPVTLNTSSITGGITTTLANFPALVYIKEDALKSGVNCANNVQYPTGGTNGYDFAFTLNGSTNELYYQVESFDPTTGTLLAWVQIPSLTSTNTALNFYFGSSSPSHPATFSSAVWSSDYLAVYHFSDAVSTGSNTTDATSNSRTATTSGMAAADRVTGKIGTAYSFNGSSKRVVGPAATVTGPFTLSAWVYLNNVGIDQKVMTNQSSSTNGGASGGYKLGVFTTNIAESESATAGNRNTLTPAAPVLGLGSTSGWYYLQNVYTGTTLSTYVNGTITKTLSTTTNPFATTPLYIGVGEGGATLYFNGYIDEPRVSNLAKSSDWIKAEYYNQNNYTTFTTSSTAITTNAANAAAIGGSIVYTWTGTTSTSPTVATNWTSAATGNPAAVPPFDGTCSLVIPTGLSRYPTLAADASIYGLTIASGGSFNLGGKTLSVGCNIYNSNGGQILYGSNTASGITWNGSTSAQTYTGTTTANTATLGTMTVNNSAAGTVTLSGGPIDIYKSLTITKGNLAVASTSTLTLKSTSTLTAYVPAIPSAYSISGNVTVERYFTGGSPSNRGWRLMSSPVNNTTTLPVTSSATYNFSSLKTNLFITGTGGSAAGFDQPTGYTANGPTILFYNTATKLFSSPSSPTVSLKAGQGFYFYFRGDKTTNVTNKVIRSGGVYATPEANVVGLQTGTLNQQSFTYTLSGGGNGYNQVGNPYPSTISMSSGALTGATGFIYTYTSGANSVTTQPGATDIASGQGFFVKLATGSTSGSIAFSESLKTVNQPTGANLLLGIPDADPEAMIKLEMIQDSANYDVTYLRYLDSYTKDYIDTEDADELTGQGQTVFFGAMTNDKHLVAINSQPIEKQGSSVFLSVNGMTSGMYTLKRMDISNIPSVYDVWLMDHFKKDSLDLRANDTYQFNLDKTNAETFGTSRFEVVIRKKSLPGFKLVKFSGNRVGTDVMLTWNTQNEFDYTQFELQKSTDGVNFDAIRNMQSSSNSTYTYKDIVAANDTARTYYRLKTIDINDQVKYSDVIIVSVQGNGAAFTIYPNPAANVINYTLTQPVRAGVRLNIYNSMGLLMKTGNFTSNTGQYDVSSLATGAYTLQLIDLDSKKILVTAKFIKL